MDPKCSLCLEIVKEYSLNLTERSKMICECYKHNSFHKLCFNKACDTFIKKCIICRTPCIVTRDDIINDGLLLQYF